MQNLISTWCRVDSRALGIYRIFIGFVCFLDIIRRWNYIDVFYSNKAIQIKNDTQFFNIFYYVGNDSFTIHAFFFIGIILSIALMMGYKTKLSHFIVSIIIIGIHGQATKVGNSGDMFLNSMLIWSLFLPLGKSISVDALMKSLKNFQELTVEDLNNRDTLINKPIQIYSIAYFAVLIQISSIYFLSALNRIGNGAWGNGTAFYKMHQLDGFITSFGYHIREYINYPISKFFTYSTLYLEYTIPFLLLIPFYSHIMRLIAIMSLTIFHLMIKLSMHIGLFTEIMISTYPLLIDKKIINSIKIKLLSKYAKNKFHLFYDSDCGFCHYTVRIIKRLDVFNRIIFSDNNSNVKKPEEFDDLAHKTAILYDSKNSQIWTRHKAFGKILSLLPFGFIMSWLFFIPFISEIFGIIYDKIAKNRTKISNLFGLPACNIKTKIQNNSNVKHNQKIKIHQHIQIISKLISPIIVMIMLISAIFSSLIEHKIIKGMTWENKQIFRKINRLPRMTQRWKMFENVPSTDQIIIVEATLDNGKKINPFTGKKSVLHSTDYKILMNNKSQLWRKYFEWLSYKALKLTNKNIYQKSGKKELLKIKHNFKNWLLNPNNNYFNQKLNGYKIKEIEIWRVSQSSPKINNKSYKRPIKATALEERTKWSNQNNENK